MTRIVRTIGSVRDSQPSFEHTSALQHERIYELIGRTATPRTQYVGLAYGPLAAVCIVTIET